MSRNSVLAAILCTSTAASAENLARGRPAAWDIAPNYARCTDAGDATQLTDGVRARQNWIWLDSLTVGWERQPGDIVTLRVDLERECRVDSIVLYTASFARSDVEPPSLVCGVGATAGDFVRAGSADASILRPPPWLRPRRVALAVSLGGARGRFVLAAAMLRGHYFFVDEIEVHGTAFDTERTDAASRSEALDSGPNGTLHAKEPYFGPMQVDSICALQRRLWALRRSLPANDLAGAGEDTEEGDRLATRGRAWRRAGRRGVSVRRVDPWAPTTPWSPPQAAVTHTLEMWTGSWNAAAIEIASAADSTLDIPVRLGAGGGLAPKADLRAVVGVEARDGRWAGDALPRLRHDTVAIRPGEVRQIWVDIDAGVASPGSYRIGIEVGDTAVVIPVRVYDVALPPRSLAALTWAYPEKFALPRSAGPARAIADNAAHGIDVWWFAEESVPWPDAGAIDAEGRLLRPPDFTRSDQQLELHRDTLRRIRDARTHDFERGFGWYWDFRHGEPDPSHGRFRHPFLSPAWKRAVGDWLAAWTAHLDSIGVRNDRVYMQPFDESTTDPVVALYRFLHEIRPDVAWALTLTRLAEDSALRDLEPVLGVAIVERVTLSQRQAWIRRVQSRGAQVWTYDVLDPAKSASPTADYRFLAWEAWARGLTGCGFWSYADTGLQSADAWNDFDASHADLTVVYGRSGWPDASFLDQDLVPSKRWRAFRVGLEEVMLFEAAAVRAPSLQREILRTVARPGRTDPEGIRQRAVRILGR